MKILTTVVIKDEKQLKNYCECVRILGGKPTISGTAVCIEYDGPKDKAEKFVQLAEQYPHHSILTLPY